MKKIICLFVTFYWFSCQDLSHKNLQNQNYQNTEASNINTHLSILPDELKHVLFMTIES